ncbi:MAG: hypothetical protein AB7E95_03565 [Kiritimatiellales bacterium]
MAYLVIAAAPLLRAELPASVMALPEVQAVLSNKCIRIEADGDAEAEFSDLLTVNRRSDLLDAVQREYAAMLPAGESPEFEVKEVGPGRYFYLNCKKQESHVHELLRDAGPDGKLHAVYKISGERFFGDFQALVHVVITDTGNGRVGYSAEVYAWPENTFCRVLARGLQFAVESFFNRETRHMTQLVLDICTRLVNGDQLALDT